MTLFGRERHPHEVPNDSPDLAYVMSFVTSVGGLSAYWTRRSSLGLLSGLGVGSAFALGGYWIQSSSPEQHEFAHQICLIASVLFGGSMGYRAGSNPYVGPGGAMLAALGGVSSAYHFKKFLEWRSWEQSRILEAERLLRDYKYKNPEKAGPVLPPLPYEQNAQHAQQQEVDPRWRPGRGPPPGPPPPATGGPYDGPGARGQGPPHLDRRSPVPPGGF